MSLTVLSLTQSCLRDKEKRTMCTFEPNTEESTLGKFSFPFMVTSKVGYKGPLEMFPKLGCNLNLQTAWTQFLWESGEKGCGEDRIVFSDSQEDSTMGMWALRCLALEPALVTVYFLFILPLTTYTYPETNLGTGVWDVQSLFLPNVSPLGWPSRKYWMINHCLLAGEI